MINYDELKTKLKCCACGGSLKDSEKVNLILLMKEAEWAHPTWGNAIVQVLGFAVAFVCDKCIKEKKNPKFAVEWDSHGTNIKYHPVENLRDVPPDIFKPLDTLEPGRHRIAG